LHLTVSCVQSKQSLDDAIEYQSARLEVLSLLLAHGADPDEIYMPVRPQNQQFPNASHIANFSFNQLFF